MRITRSQRVKLALFGEDELAQLKILYCEDKTPVSNDYSGRRIGKLQVLYRISHRSNTSYWMCQCECGKYFIASSNLLKDQLAPDCGCVKEQKEQISKQVTLKTNPVKVTDSIKGTKGEVLITKILLENNIPFEREYVVKLPDGSKGRFDFFVDNKYFIEYDGEQHFVAVGAWNGNDGLAKRMEKDALKNEYCMMERIPLIRIPYTEEKIVLETLLINSTPYLFYNGEEVKLEDVYYLNHEI